MVTVCKGRVYPGSAGPGLKTKHFLLGPSWMHINGDQEVVGLTPPGQQHSLVEIDHEIFSMVILSLPLIQERQLSVSGKRMYTLLVNRLED